MKKAHNVSRHVGEADALQPEYAFDYRKARPNRFASRLADGSMVVVLEPRIAKAFNSPREVNNLLRALAAAMPKPMRG